MKTILIALLLLAPMSAQVTKTLTTDSKGTPQITYKGLIPAVSTTAVSGLVKLKSVVLINTSASAVTCTIVDISTDCGAAACQVAPTGSLAANTMWVWEFGTAHMAVDGGIAWSCSTASVVVGRIIAER
jgi:hypothetical protein